MIDDVFARYAADGFIVVDDAIPAVDIAACLEDIDQLFRRQAALLGLDVATPDLSGMLVALFRADMRRYLQAARAAQHLPSLHALGLSSAILGLAARLGIAQPIISTRPVLHIMADDLRVPGGYHKTPAHQDWRSVQGSLNGITIWVPLVEVGFADYPLEVAVGSHRLGLLPSDEDAFGHRVSDAAGAGLEFTALPMTVGQAVGFSGFLVHRTGEEGGTKVRLSASFRFNDAADPGFAGRGYPNPYGYKADMRLIEPSPATREAILAWFDQPPQRR